jgi:hypothetical protein
MAEIPRESDSRVPQVAAQLYDPRSAECQDARALAEAFLDVARGKHGEQPER